MIAGYLNAVSAALSFDSALARCVRDEVEDHLHEAMAADPAGDRIAAEQRAIANFGDPLSLAAQFAAISLTKQMRRAGFAVIMVIAGTLAAMKVRVAWYAAMQWSVSDEMRAISGLVLAIDRYAFWLSVFTAIAGWAYISSRAMPVVVHARYRRQLRRAWLLCAAATVCLVVSVISDGVLTAIQLGGSDLCAGSLPPILSMLVEVAAIGVLAVEIARMAARAASTAALMKV
jgi:hypothetical protein